MAYSIFLKMYVFGRTNGWYLTLVIVSISRNPELKREIETIGSTAGITNIVFGWNWLNRFSQWLKLGHYNNHSLGCPPSQDASHHQDYYIFSRGIPINLHLPQLLGGGDNPNHSPLRGISHIMELTKVSFLVFIRNAINIVSIDFYGSKNRG